MIVVSDTTPLISLMKINQLEILQKLFGKIIIPTAVYNELTTNVSFPIESKIIQNCDFITTVNIEDKSAVSHLRKTTGLDAGESEAIVIAETMDNVMLLIDEACGRKVAKRMNLNVMGTIGVLLLANQKNILSKEDISKSVEIIRKSKLRITEKLIEMLLKNIK
ncbi:MAG: DUF3368 domain-containing protein [Spirochaetales bacterium]|nr:DUF3368 domain-containing protein [Spirochaetales bacterium]MBR6198737.1 DUF3368 domain-containing protein [Spirochaetales bacterium]